MRVCNSDKDPPPPAESVMRPGATLAENLEDIDGQLDIFNAEDKILDQFKLLGKASRKHGSALVPTHGTVLCTSSEHLGSPC